MWDLYGREIFLTLHIFGVIVWLGFGFFELWIGRIVMSNPDAQSAAPMMRLAYRADIVVFMATLLVFAIGIAQTVLFGWGWFGTLWLGVKQSLMIAILVMVAVIFPHATGIGKLIGKLPDGDGPVTPEITKAYGWLEPWYWTMRLAGAVAVVFAVAKPV